jgi:hypothetical protein
MSVWYNAMRLGWREWMPFKQLKRRILSPCSTVRIAWPLAARAAAGEVADRLREPAGAER